MIYISPDAQFSADQEYTVIISFEHFLIEKFMYLKKITSTILLLGYLAHSMQYNVTQKGQVLATQRDGPQPQSSITPWRVEGSLDARSLGGFKDLELPSTAGGATARWSIRIFETSTSEGIEGILVERLVLKQALCLCLDRSLLKL
jgi:hypothetical protein